MKRQLPEHLHQRAHLHGHTATTTLFAQMLNPDARRSAWDWSKLADEAAEDARAFTPMGFSEATWKRWGRQIEESAVYAARYTAECILRRSRIAEWWPDPMRQLPPRPTSSPTSTLENPNG
jgi:hypothetical protein